MQMKTFEYANQNIRTCKSKHSNMQMQYVLFDSTFQGSELLLENNKFHENANDYYSKLLELVTYFTGELLFTSIKKTRGVTIPYQIKTGGITFLGELLSTG